MASVFERLWCRTFQTVLKVGNYFMGYRMPQYLEGPGKIKELGAFLKEKKDQRCAGSHRLRHGAPVISAAYAGRF